MEEVRMYEEKQSLASKIAIPILLVAALVVMIVTSGCGDTNLALWGLSAPEQDLTARIGLERGNAEVGLTAKYVASESIALDEGEIEPDEIGGYLIFHLTQDVTVEDTPNRSPIAPFLESLHARPYAGLELVSPYSGDGRKFQPNWIVGTEFTIAPMDDFAFVVEYVDGEQGTNGVFLGGRARF